MGQSFSPGWDDVRELLNHEIQVFYTKNEQTNREREYYKRKTINWIIERMQMGAKSGGTRILAPIYTQTFGNLCKPVKNAMRLMYSSCYICGSPAEEVHHIRPRMLQGSEYDPCNLVCLCAECHDNIHRVLDDNISKAVKDSLQIKRKYKPVEEWDE